MVRYPTEDRESDLPDFAFCFAWQSLSLYIGFWAFATTGMTQIVLAIVSIGLLGGLFVSAGSEEGEWLLALFGILLLTPFTVCSAWLLFAITEQWFIP